MTRRAWMITRVGVKQLFKDPLYMMFFLAMPVMMSWLMGFLPREAAGLATSGVMVMFVGLTLITSAGSVLEERQQGTWARLLAAPVAPWEVFSGFFARSFLMGWIQAGLLILAGRYLFALPWKVQSADLFLVLGAYILAMSGLGLLLAGFLKTLPQVQMVSTGIVMVGSMLGGVFFPVNTKSPLMTAIARISPQGWAARAINDLLAGKAAPAAAGPIVWLFGLGLVFLALGIWRMGRERG
ncbi:MAG: ABC transporter permease [Firmicutes bacterium]|nr:ABC transporter permease [Bacillota bacterium]